MKALVLFSGGLDSSVCLGLAVEKYGADQVLALSIMVRNIKKRWKHLRMLQNIMV